MKHLFRVRELRVKGNQPLSNNVMLIYVLRAYHHHALIMFRSFP